MHTSELSEDTYEPDNTQPTFMDLPLTPANVDSGDLALRFDPIAFPQLGITYSGEDSDGNDVPPAPVSDQG